MRTSFLVTFEEGTAGRNDAARSFDRNTTTFYGSPAELRALRLERMRRSGSGIAICVEDTAGGRVRQEEAVAKSKRTVWQRSTRSELVRIFLAGKENDIAWETFTGGPVGTQRWLETAAVRGKTHPRDAIALYHGLLPVAAAVRATPGMTRRLKSCRPLACCGRGWMSMRNSPVNWRGFRRHIGQSATSSSCSPSCPGIALRPFRPIAQQRAHRRHRAGAGDTEKCTPLSCAVLTFTQN
ncbi:zinc finger SWIM domain-containing protein [Burkholderia pseudomallei]|nr:hypothetical protein DU27_431 [Burkholderia pseudomallei]CAJ2755433.1 zinc finger SWIM domain-containing protein [Burkholderia pseudomallei]CAJ2885437.1 zinc finger SWIM domain-containing protein [Burkholderia pseudomallei]CAJ3566923.1 zinc finger SWIM domain-containing protein [Burkholderia pseudomallei]CAJ3708169.1 zinc finger SWIM domain-containing protein [Burkholderia pseudomallei]